jgi:hypothetical protein
MDDLEARVDAVDGAHDGVAAVPAPVVDEQHLRLAVELLQQAAEPGIELRQHRLLVVHGNDEGVPRMAHGLHLPVLLERKGRRT